MSPDNQTILLETPRAVDVVAIEQELVQLWKTPLTVSHDGQMSPVVRACALNLIVVSENEQELEALAGIIGDVTIEHPARIFLVLLDRRSPASSFEAWVSARCTLPIPGGQQVCCEQVTLKARSADAAKVPSVVTSLLVPDVPTVMLWKTEVDDYDAVLRAMTHISDRVLVDTSESLDPITVLPVWQRIIAQQEGVATFGDLAWTHITAWRGLMAQVFQPVHMRVHLGTLSEVTIAYSSTEVLQHSGLSQSFLLMGWLSSALNWPPTQNLKKTGTGEYLGEAEAGGNTIALRIHSTPSTGSLPGGIENVTLRSVNGFRLELNATGTGTCIRLLSQFDGHTTEETHAIADQSEAELVARELELLGRDTHYERSLTALVAMTKEAPRVPATLVVHESMNELARDAAEHIRDLLQQAITQRGIASLVLAGGGTPRNVYELLASDPFRGAIAWNKVHLFWGDERCVPPYMPESNYYMANTAFIRRIGIPPSNVHRVRAELSPEEAASAYEAEIRELFRLDEGELPEFDVMLLGLGEDGHTASLFPGSAALEEKSRIVVSTHVEQLMTTRVTLTLPVINRSHTVIFLVSGRQKSSILQAVLENASGRYPAELVRPASREILWLVDRDAASMLRKATS